MAEDGMAASTATGRPPRRRGSQEKGSGLAVGSGAALLFSALGHALLLFMALSWGAGAPGEGKVLWVDIVEGPHPGPVARGEAQTALPPAEFQGGGPLSDGEDVRPREAGREETPPVPFPPSDEGDALMLAGHEAPAEGASAGRPEGAGRREGLILGIRASIQDAAAYPLMARKRGMEGTVVAGFLIDPHGMPYHIYLIKSSGCGVLDEEVLRAIRTASPYPPLDGGIEVPVRFRLTEGVKGRF